MKLCEPQKTPENEEEGKNFVFGCGCRGHIFDSIIPSNHGQEA